MSSMKEVQQLLAGSRRINEMKRDVDMIISMINGFLTLHDVVRFQPHKGILGFTSGGLRWRVYRGTELKAPYFHVEVTVEDAQSERCIVVYSSFIQRDVPLQYVQQLYDGLAQFLQNMKSAFPVLRAKLLPLMAAGIQVDE